VHRRRNILLGDDSRQEAGQSLPLRIA